MAEPHLYVVGVLEEAIVLDDLGPPSVPFFLLGVGVRRGFPLENVRPVQLKREVGVVELACAVDGSALLAGQES